MSPPRHLVIDARSIRARRTGVGNSVYRQLLGIDRLLDMARTTVNVLGDLTATAFIARRESHWSAASIPNSEKP